MNTDEWDVQIAPSESWRDRSDLTGRVIGAGFTISNTLGCGFLEKVYENALAYELRKINFCVQQQYRIPVIYDGIVVGEYVADLLVEGKILIEVKACHSLDDVHVAQCLNYLKGTGLPVCLLMNFGRPRLEVRRLLKRDEPAKPIVTGPGRIRQARNFA